MKKEIKERWIAALRSKEYKQGKNALKSGDKYCCLGVLCDISKIGVWAEIGHQGQGYKVGPYDWSTSVLPDSVREWAGLDRVDPIIDPSGSLESSQDYHVTHASVANDAGFSFSAIADLIEQNL